MQITQYDLIPIRTKQVQIGQTFGRLTVRSVGRTDRRRYFAVCDCACGEVGRIVQIGHLTTGTTKSCGCERKARLATHGLSKSPLFRRWQGMMRRCYSANHKNFKSYGGRGISVCDRWHDPHNFIADMQDGFLPNLEIDRIDNDGNYCPENCRWVSTQANQDNRGVTRKVTHQGETLSMSQWAGKTGIPAKLLAKRIFERGWPIGRALSTPVMSRRETAIVANRASHASRRSD